MASLCFCKRKYFYHKEGNYLPMITTNFYLKSFCFWTEDSFLQLLFEDHILHISQWNYGSCFQKVKNKKIFIVFVCWFTSHFLDSLPLLMLEYQPVSFLEITPFSQDSNYEKIHICFHQTNFQKVMFWCFF